MPRPSYSVTFAMCPITLHSVLAEQEASQLITTLCQPTNIYMVMPQVRTLLRIAHKLSCIPCGPREQH